LSLFLLVEAVSLRSIILLKPGTIPGHNWDWTFPNLDVLFNRLTTAFSYYTWSGWNLGGALNLTISHLVPNTAVTLLNHVLGSQRTVQFVLFVLPVVAFLSLRALLRELRGGETPAEYFSSTLFALSPFFMSDVIGGSWYMWISYSFAPAFVLYLLRFCESGRLISLCCFLAASFFVVSSLQHFVLIEIIFALFLLFRISTRRYAGRNGIVAARYCSGHLSLAILNVYWLLPFASSFLSFAHNVMLNPKMTGGYESVRNSTQSLWNIASLTGYLDRNMYFHTLPDFMVPLFVFVVFAIWFVVLFRFAWDRALDQEAFCWLGILLLFVFLIKGGNLPFSGATMWVYSHFKLMSLFRSPQHLMFVASFIIPIIFAYALDFPFLRSFGVGADSLFIVAGLVWICGWWYWGDLGHRILLQKGRDHVDFYSLSPGLRGFYQRNENSRLDHRVLFLPAASSPNIHGTEYQGVAQGLQAEYMYLKNPTLSSEQDPNAAELESAFGKMDAAHSVGSLPLFSVRDVVLRSDVSPKFTESAAYWDDRAVRRFLDGSSSLKLFLDAEYTRGYRVVPSSFLPHFYTPTQVVVSGRRSDVFKEISSSPDAPLRIACVENWDGAVELSPGNNIHLEFRKISPVRYRLRVHGAGGVFPLVFNEHFNGDWKVYPGNLRNPRRSVSASGERLRDYRVLDGNEEDQADAGLVTEFMKKGWVSAFGNSHGGRGMDFVSKDFQDTIQNDNLLSGPFWETWFKLPVSNEESHRIANGYSNYWTIDAERVFERCPNACVKNDDGAYDLELVVEYWPQRLLVLGLLISGTFLLILLFAGLWPCLLRGK
jgi:hypothetical protein